MRKASARAGLRGVAVSSRQRRRRARAVHLSGGWVRGVAEASRLQARRGPQGRLLQPGRQLGSTSCLQPPQAGLRLNTLLSRLPPPPLVLGQECYWHAPTDPGTEAGDQERPGHQQGRRSMGRAPWVPGPLTFGRLAGKDVPRPRPPDQRVWEAAAPPPRLRARPWLPRPADPGPWS